MKININQIAPEGLSLEEEIPASSLELETDIVSFPGPIKIKARISRITNTVTVYLTLNALMHTKCSRCLNEFAFDFKKDVALNYPVSESEPLIDTSMLLECHGKRSRTIDLNPDIRDEIILDYPIKPLCNPECKGLCPKCGKNLNVGKCICVH